MEHPGLNIWLARDTEERVRKGGFLDTTRHESYVEFDLDEAVKNRGDGATRLGSLCTSRPEFPETAPGRLPSLSH